jgi:starch-binding outer membrane protein, SusD/RagB family
VNKHLKGAICAAGLALVAAGCNNFLKGGDLNKDPNNPVDASPSQFFASAQSNLWQQQSGDLARLTSLWMQQIVGEQRQMRDEYEYQGVVEGSFDAEYSRAYQGGGRLDLLKADSIAATFGDSISLGVSKVVEAWMIGTDADIWGDIPYSQADSFFTYPTPKLDPQQDVYTGVQKLLSEAITDLETGVGDGPGSFDLVYGGDPTKWIALAHTLKARFFLHTAEVLGTPAYQSALAEANLGISSNDDDYIANFSGSQALESNPWWQFADADGSTGRAGDLAGIPSHLDSLLRGSDPRDTVYFAQIVDSFFVKPLTKAHHVSHPTFQPGDTTVVDTTNADQSFFSSARLDFKYPQPYVTYNENLLIKAEAEFNTGATGAALADLNTERAAWATPTPWHSKVVLPAIGAASLNAIMTEKYIVLFQNIETWNDYKRTCIPALTPVNNSQGGVIPGRLLYPLNEHQTNPNFPAPGQQPARNWNDPNACGD